MNSLHLFEGLGIELEYMLVDAGTLAVAPQADWLLAEAAGEVTDEYLNGALAWNNELALHVIELKLSKPRAELDGLSETFQAEIAKVNEILQRRRLCLMPTGMHPWMDPAKELRLWPHGNRGIYEAFDRAFSCRGHGWANLQSMHLNLPFADEQEFAKLHAAIRFLLPLMPCLTASSPVMDEKLTGVADNRLAVYRTNCASLPSITGAVVPEAVFSISEYRTKILDRISADIAAFDPDGILVAEWVNARGAIARFDRMAIEIRVLDVQECPAMDIAFARLIAWTLRRLCEERWCDLAALRNWQTSDLARYYDASVVQAEATQIHDRRFLASLGYPESQTNALRLWGHLAECAAADGAFDREAETAIEHYLCEGTLATRIAAALPHEPSLDDLKPVYGRLCECLVRGRPFSVRSDS